MKIFLDIGHPAHVHYFKYLINRLEKKGHRFVITSRDKEMAHYLLSQTGHSYISRGKGGVTVWDKATYIFKADYQLYAVAKKEKPDLFLSFASPYCSHVAFLMRKPHIALDDTETASIGQFLYKPFSDVILTPKCFKKNFGKKQIRYPSYIELSYLHRNLFTPDENVYNELGIEYNEPYVIVRFVGLYAAHDKGQKGISIENRLKAVQAFSKKAKVFISSEKQLPSELEKYKLNITPERIHHALAYASMFFGESGTMSSESAMLGTPAIFVNDKADELGTIIEQAENYKLVFPFSESNEDQLKSISKGLEILDVKPEIWQKRQKKLLQENIDVTSFLESFIENYPESKNKYKQYFKV